MSMCFESGIFRNSKLHGSINQNINLHVEITSLIFGQCESCSMLTSEVRRWKSDIFRLPDFKVKGKTYSWLSLVINKLAS